MSDIPSAGRSEAMFGACEPVAKSGPAQDTHSNGKATSIPPQTGFMIAISNDGCIYQDFNNNCEHIKTPHGKCKEEDCPILLKARVVER